MRIKIFAKKLIAISVAVLSTVTLANCFDLGDFSDESAYYAAFGDIGLIDGSRTEKEGGEVVREINQEDYDIQEYFYKDSFNVKSSVGEAEEKYTPQLPYIYMAIPVEQDMNVDSLVLYFNATKACALETSFYVVDTLPDFTNIRLLGDPEYQQKYDEGTGELIEEKLQYTDPDDTLLVGTTSVQVKDGVWVSLLMDTWNGADVIKINAGQYLLLRFMNNSGGYVGEQEVASVTFSVANLLIRTVS